MTATADAVRNTSRGAGLLTVSSVLVGLGNYGYSLLLARLLTPELFGDFAAAQGLVLVCGTVATGSVPWVVAHVLALTPDPRRRCEVVWFSLLMNLVQGTVAAGAVLAVTMWFLPAGDAAWAAGAALAVFVVTTPAGSFQGDQRFTALGVLRVAEVVLKVVFGLVLVVNGAGVGGALAAAALAAAAIAVMGLVVIRREVRPVRSALRLGHLWRTSLGVVGVQGLVAVLAGLDIVLVAVLDVDPVAAGSYQAAAVLGRVPTFLGAALATAVYAPIVRGGPASSSVMAATLRTYGLLATAYLVVLLSAPAPILALVFPPEYALVGTLLPYTAAAGAGAGAVNVITTWFQATGRYRASVLRQSAGIAAAMTLLLVGFAVGGLRGLAIAAALGPWLTAALLLLAAREVWPPAWVCRRDAALLVLFLLMAWAARTWPPLWPIVTGLSGALALRRLVSGRKAPTPAGTRGPRVLHLAFEDPRRPGAGGGAYRSWEVNRRLARDHDVVMVTTTWRGARDYVQDGVRVVHIGLPWGYWIEVITYFLLLPLAVRRHRSELVVEDFAAPISSALVPLYAGDRAVVAVVQWLNAEEKRRQYHLPVHVFERLGLRVHRHFVAVSDGIAERIRDRSRPDAEITVVPNGVDRAAFSVVEPRGPDIVFLGRLEVGQKGLDLLAQAWALAAPRLPGARLTIAGAGAGERRLRRDLARFAVESTVDLVGPVTGEDKLRLLAGARVTAMPSRFETFGIVAVESLACGTPVVAFDIPCLREVVPPGAGALVPAFDVPAFAEALVQTANASDDVVAERAQQGREFARRYDWDAVAQQQARAYRGAIQAWHLQNKETSR